VSKKLHPLLHNNVNQIVGRIKKQCWPKWTIDFVAVAWVKPLECRCTKRSRPGQKRLVWCLGTLRLEGTPFSFGNTAPCRVESPRGRARSGQSPLGVNPPRGNSSLRGNAHQSQLWRSTIVGWSPKEGRWLPDGGVMICWVQSPCHLKCNWYLH
jgi:hypothetical protein